MKRTNLIIVAGLLLSLASTSLFAQTLPEKLTDEEFWKLSSESSEPDGYFRSDNLLSNESYFQYVIPHLLATAKAGRVYMGVGPEQNFTYIAALKPKMVFIVDIRRGNLDLQLLYKALFELSTDRIDFVSKLFSKKRPEGLSAKSTADEIFSAFGYGQASEAIYKENLKAVLDHLTKTHHFPLSDGDLDGVEYVYNMFYRFGPRINYASSGRGGGGNNVNYATLMMATDEGGTARGYLANEDNFNVMKSLESKNLVVPVVGNFAGPKALRAVGNYIRSKQGTVSAFYLSNVEQYLSQDGIWDDFCRNVSTLPLDNASTFIRSVRGGRYGNGVGLNSDLGNMTAEVKDCTPGK